ncbi:MAG: hypothetical protein V3V15_07590 [Sphingorhabdus sp.]
MVITLTSALLLSMTAYAYTPMDDARIRLNNCLVDLSIEHLDKKTNQGGFRKATETGCAEERQIFFDIVARDERKYGSNKSESETYAGEEVQGIINGFLERYSEYEMDKTRPVKEK